MLGLVISPVPEKAIPSEELIDILIKLENNPKTKVIIISGRIYQDIDKLLGHLPIVLIAEHGAMFKINGKWKKQTIDNDLWKNKVLPILNQITLTCPKSFVEEKQFSLNWDYRYADSESGYLRSREIIRILEENYIQFYNLKILDGNKSIEIISKEISKGKAIIKMIEQNNYDYILSIGDDATDEEMFEFLLDQPNAETIKIGNTTTLAKHKLNNVKDVIILLKQLSLCD
ncbi:MAG TPA: trehalose-phosphatase [Rikenellaceae bacterium]|nr:trehalose-phosphatase [Rikenellaceae bacterium]